MERVSTLPMSACREVIGQREQLDHPGSLTGSPLSLGPVVWQGSPAPFLFARSNGVAGERRGSYSDPLEATSPSRKLP